MSTCEVDSSAEMLRWRKKARWNSSIAHHDRIHPLLYVGSRLSVEKLLQGTQVKDQNDESYAFGDFYYVCVAGRSVCTYAHCCPVARGFYMRDRVYEDCSRVLQDIEPVVRHIHRLLQTGRKVLVHCHAGQNRAAFCVAMLSATYGMGESLERVIRIMREDNAKRDINQSLVNHTLMGCVAKHWARCDAKRQKATSRKNWVCRMFRGSKGP